MLVYVRELCSEVDHVWVGVGSHMGWSCALCGCCGCIWEGVVLGSRSRLGWSSITHGLELCLEPHCLCVGVVLGINQHKAWGWGSARVGVGYEFLGWSHAQV